MRPQRQSRLPNAMPAKVGFSQCSSCLLTTAAPALAADEPDLIFRRSTVVQFAEPDTDKLATYGLDDPEVEGVACHFTVPEQGG